MVYSGKELIQRCQEENKQIWEISIDEEINQTEKSLEEIWKKMSDILDVMMKSSEKGLNEKISSLSGLIGGDAYKVSKYIETNEPLCGSFLLKAMGRALSNSEVNASMGKIAACPTAGACGILPAALISTAEKLKLSTDSIIKALFTAALIGGIIGKNATISGAQGGCQAECGSGSAMASAAVVQMLGGTPEQSLHAAAICIKTILGLVCDPVAGLVEVPCAKRNALGVVSALSIADLVMCGVKSIIPFDEVVEAMNRVGRQMPHELRETALGGLATTKTAKQYEKAIFNK